MTARPLLPGSPLTPDHARQLESLLETLNPDEALWISGFLAGFARQQGEGTGPHREPEASLLILYGSETGHAAGIAEAAAAAAKARGLAARAMDMADFRPQALAETPFLMALTSTYGDGDPPVGAMDFMEYILGRKAHRLDKLKFAVLGLGDSSYEHFCQTARDLDGRLEALGGRRLVERLDCDVDYEAPAQAWVDRALAAFAGEMAAAPAALAAAVPAKAAPSIDARHPFPATILTNINLNGRGSDKETRHLELSLAGSGLTWEPGDALGIVPVNDPALVDELLQALDLRADEPVPGGEGDIPLVQALSRHYEITTLTPRFLESYGQEAGAKGILDMDEAGRRAYMAGRQLIDVATEFPARGLGGRALAAMLRPLQPRLYSLASSPAAFPDEAHLTVAVVRYESFRRRRRGVTSAYLAERREEGETVPVHVSANRNFRLPADGATPIVMVGAGTGIAPFRAFMQHREATGARGRNWLFFGDRRFRTDFLYQSEWQRLIRDGVLTRMEVAFSRDQEEKIYVQHRLLEEGAEIYRWLQEGAHFYVCGDASHLAPDVHGALAAVVSRHGGLGAEEAEEYLKDLHREKRYQRDVY